MIFEYDPKHDLSWGYYRCENCESIFWDTRHQIHKDGCSSGNNSDNLVYFFGPREAKRVIIEGASVFSRLRKNHVNDLLASEETERILTTSDHSLFQK